MLNRNQHYSSQLYDLEQEKEEDRERERMQEEEKRREAADKQRMQEILEAHRRQEEDRKRQNLLDLDSSPSFAQMGVNIDPTVHRSLYTSSDRQTTPKDDFFSSEQQRGDFLSTKESSERASTQPFSPKASASFEYTGGATATSSSSAHSTLTSGTKGQAVSVVSVETHEFKRQETTEDVNDIEEDIVDNIEAGKDDDSDDGFNF